MADDTDSGATDIIGHSEFTLSCQKCGSNELTIPDEATEDSRLTCASCGADGGRWGDVQAAVMEASGKQFEESLTDAIGQGFNGEDGISFKKVE